MDANLAEAPIVAFALDQWTHRVVFGSRVADVLDDALSALGIKQYLLVTTPQLADTFNHLASKNTKMLCAAMFTNVVPHVPEASVFDGIAVTKSCRADGLVVFGGGTALDTGKAISDQLGLPILAIPTNFSGSEVTWNYGLTVGGMKQTRRNPKVLARTVIYDPELLCTLPLDVAVCSGVNAVAHAIEAMYAPQSNVFTNALAEAGIRKMIQGLNAFGQGNRKEAGPLCFAGSWLCGEVLSQVGMGLHHRICHVLGGTYGLPHAEVHTALLPYSIVFNYESATALSSLADLFPGQALGPGLAAFSIGLGAPKSLQAIGFNAEKIVECAALAMSMPVSNPRPVTVGDVQQILQDAFAGRMAV
jgi:maleylacetate reductase